MSDTEKPFVETVRIQNFGCARDVTLELTRLHALIGPNDSGKSTVLAAVGTACELIRLGEHALRVDARAAIGSVFTVPRPKLEGWILCLLGVTRTDGMTKARVDLELARTNVQLRSNADYVAVVERCVLPTGAGSLPKWLALANVTFRRLIDGVTSE